MPKIVFRLPRRPELAVEVPAGISLLEAARRHGIAIEGACGGSMACATCHVHVDDGFADLLPPPSAEEEDMLDLAADLAPTSRLSCQIRVTADLDGLIVAVPQSTLLE